MKSVCFLVVLLTGLLGVGNSFAQQATDGTEVPDLAVFDEAMVRFMRNHNIPDGQLALTWQGRLVLARSYSHNSQNPVNNQSRFRVASVSKPITSTLVHKAIQEGLITRQDTLGEHLDLTPPAGQMADARLSSITLRNLLEHLAGFGDPATIGFDPMFNDRSIASSLGVPLPLLKSNVQTFMHGRQLLLQPGQDFGYSNYGFMLAGRMIESATGLPYAAWADTVLNSVGIYDARLSRSEQHRAYTGDAVYNSGYSGFSSLSESSEQLPFEYGGINYENIEAAGGWSLSMTEAARWLSSLDSNELLDRPIKELMFGLPENFQGEYNEGDQYYASGWSVRDYGVGGVNSWHGGSLPSTTAYVVRVRNGFNFATAFNRRNELAPGEWISDLENEIISALGQVTNWPTHDLFEQELRAAPPPVTARHSGTWYDATHNGEGFVVSVINPTLATVYWFTYGRDGRQQWYFGLARIEGHRLIVDELLEPSGGRFGPDFDPATVMYTPVGSLVLNYHDLSNGKADYLLNGDSGYMELSRVSQPFSTDEPETAGDWRNGIWYDPTHDGEGYVVEVLPNGLVLVYWFTYDDQGRPAWMLATANEQSLDDGIDLGMLRPVGGNFGVVFDPDNVSYPNNGALKLKIGCSGINTAEYGGGDAPFVQVEQALVAVATFVPPPCNP